MKKAPAAAKNKTGYFSPDASVRISYPVIIALLAFILYLNTTRNQYGIDDNLVVLNEMVQKGIKAIPEIFTSRYQTAGAYYYGYRPIGKATFAIEQSLFGRNPAVSHMINVLLYAVSCIVLWIVLKRVLTGYHPLFIFCAVVLFTAHPVHTETVASLKNREEILCFLFSFLSLHQIVLFKDHSKTKHLLAGFFFLLLGFLSKQNAASFILLIPLTLILFGRYAGRRANDTAPSSGSDDSGHKNISGKAYPVSSLIGANIFLLCGIFLCITGMVTGIKRLIPIGDFVILVDCLVKSINRGRLARMLRNGWFIAGMLIIPVAVMMGKPVYLLSALFIIVYNYSAQGDFRELIHSFFKTTGRMFAPARNSLVFILTGLNKYRYPVILFIVLAIIAAGIFLIPDQFLPAQKRELHAFENPLFGYNEWFARIALGFYSLLIYLKLLFYPHPLLFYYGYKHIPDACMTDPMVILSILIHSGLIFISVYFFNKQRIISYAVLFYLLSVFLVSNIPAPVPGIIAERLLFVPSLGFCLAIAWLIFRIFRIDPLTSNIPSPVKRKIIVLLVLVLIPYALKIFYRNRDWKDEMTLFAHDIPYLKNSLHANVLYASQLVMRFQGQPANRQEVNETMKNAALALRHFKLALAVDSTHVKTLVNTGTLYYQFFHRYDSAEYFLYKALKYDSLFSLGWFNLGICYEWQSKPGKAIPCYLKALATDSLNINILSNLATAYYNSGRWDNAVVTNQKIMTVNPSSDIPYLNMGSYYLAAKDEDSAVPWLEKAVEKNPGNQSLCVQLGNYFKDKGNQQKAFYYFNLANKKN